MRIRPAVRADAAALAVIYAHYVLHSLVTFEVTPPDEEELAGRMEAVVERLHERCGFSVAGRLSGVGLKHGRWLDTILMQRPLTREPA